MTLSEKTLQLPQWSIHQSPLYDIDKSYLDNFLNGPIFKGPFPKRPDKNLTNIHSFLGYDVRSKIGVAAGPLLSSEWINAASKLGFDIVTYKTIRSHKHPSHPLPNMLYVDINKTNGHITEAVTRSSMPNLLSDLAVTNSFGMPSMEKDFLLKDIEKANASLDRHQIMIVSIVGTVSSRIDLFQDFVEAACLAKDAGAKIIEANFSCPNVTSKEGSIYTDPDSVYILGKMLKKALGSIPLIIKVGYLENQEAIKQLALAAARAKVDAISGINTLSMQVKTKDGIAALGDKRLRSGICGGPIKNFGLDFIQKLSKISRENNLNLTLIGVGGIMTPLDFNEYFDCGAHFAQSATGMIWDPFLAMRYHNQGHISCLKHIK